MKLKRCHRSPSRRPSILIGLVIIVLVLFVSFFVHILPSPKRLYCPENQYYNGSFMVREEVKSVEFIDIIGIGVYTWHHLLNGSLDVSDRKKKIYTSNKTIDGVSFKYKLKCCYPEPNDNFTIDNEDRNVILAIWGRRGRKSINIIRKAIKNPSIRNLALIIFGDVNCNDAYLYEALRCSKLRFVYVTHESHMIDDRRVFLWPLGTQMAAGHEIRYFSPFIHSKPVDLDSTRRYTSTFIGAVGRAGRERMVAAVTENKQLFDNDKHLFSFRPRWRTQLSPTVDDVYEYSLRNSDLTISPKGNAPECFRTFEALEFGSIPVIEDKVNSKCLIRNTHTHQAPNRILKEYGAPVYYVKDWASDLPKILREFGQFSAAEKRAKRRKVHEWYGSFKVKLGRKLIDDVKGLFV